MPSRVPSASRPDLNTRLRRCCSRPFRGLHLLPLSSGDGLAAGLPSSDRAARSLGRGQSRSNHSFAPPVWTGSC